MSERDATDSEDRTTWSKAGRWLRRALLALLAVLGIFLAVVVIDGWAAFGRAAEGERLARMERSPQYGDGEFVNEEPMVNDAWGSFTGVFSASADGSPTSPLPVVAVDPERLAVAPASGLRVTWLGHSTLLIELDGHRVLTDPVFGERASPVDWLGPARWYPPPIALEALGRLDAVIISHDHYDHLDEPTIVAMRDWDTVFVVPLGVAAHLEYWGIAAERIVELDWWEQATVGGLEVVATPARHASGRMLLDTNETLWASYALLGPRHRVWFSGDTGLFSALREIGERLGPFDLTMIEVGAYGAAWPDWHLGPEQAVLAHRLVRGRLLLPIHWGLFNLAFHAWTEPVERVHAAAEKAKVALVVPRPGESIEPAAAPSSPQRWWPQVPWQTASEAPIISGGLDRSLLDGLRP